MLRSLPWPHILQLPPQLVCSPLWPDFVEAVPLPILCCGTRVPGRPPGPPPAARVLAPLQWHNVSNILYTLHSTTLLYGKYISITKQRGQGRVCEPGKRTSLFQGSHCRFLLGKVHSDNFRSYFISLATLNAKHLFRELLKFEDRTAWVSAVSQRCVCSFQAQFFCWKRQLPKAPMIRE